MRTNSSPGEKQKMAVPAVYDAVVVGSGPNGLTAAITLAEAGLRVVVLEARETIGGGARSAELTLPGFLHDTCSAIHPTGVVSPAFQKIGLEALGVEWIYPEVAVAHPLPDGEAALLYPSLEKTCARLGEDARSYARLMEPFLRHGAKFFKEILQPIRIPSHPVMMLRFGWQALRSAEAVINQRFGGAQARALFAGCAAHAIEPLQGAGTASFGLVLALAGHAIGWPCARNGSQTIIAALEKRLRQLGGEIVTGHAVRSMRDIPEARVVLFDISPRQLLAIAGEDLPARYRRKLEGFRFGPGVFKIDWALSGEIPWKQAGCNLAGTVHVGGTAEEVMRAEHQVGNGKVPEQPFVLVAQQSLFDPGRAPRGQHTGWAYCHVPHGCDTNMTDRIEKQIERFAPGFRDLILARQVISPREYERYNANFVGGDIGGGANDLVQTIFRPFPQLDPYATGNPRFFLCSSSTPPGGGVHGMCGYWAARSALKRRFGRG